MVGSEFPKRNTLAILISIIAFAVDAAAGVLFAIALNRLSDGKFNQP